MFNWRFGRKAFHFYRAIKERNCDTVCVFSSVFLVIFVLFDLNCDFNKSVLVSCVGRCDICISISFGHTKLECNCYFIWKRCPIQLNLIASHFLYYSNNNLIFSLYDLFAVLISTSQLRWMKNIAFRFGFRKWKWLFQSNAKYFECMIFGFVIFVRLFVCCMRFCFRLPWFHIWRIQQNTVLTFLC